MAVLYILELISSYDSCRAGGIVLHILILVDFISGFSVCIGMQWLL